MIHLRRDVLLWNLPQPREVELEEAESAAQLKQREKDLFRASLREVRRVRGAGAPGKGKKVSDQVFTELFRRSSWGAGGLSVPSAA